MGLTEAYEIALATPEDIAYAAVFLASDESRMLTGDSINVDGGTGL
jgi:NAD(P)-dependent dehydrogenase (short-subunit alcohol dehydrogenase family)